MNVTFCGHGKIDHQEPVKKWLDTVLPELIEQGADVFYLGGYGDFDRMAAAAVRRQKLAYPDIEMVLVLAYLNGKKDDSEYDSTVYPPLEKVLPRYAISKRNRWMVEQSEVVVAYVQYSWGGAATTLEYAQKKKKKIVRFEKSDS